MSGILEEMDSKRTVNMNYATFDDWYARGQQLADAWDAKKEEIGRWVIDGENQFGERASQGYNLFDYHTLQNYSSAMRRTPDSVLPANPKRRVGMSARQAVAPLAAYPDAQKTLLAAYGDKHIDRDKLREEVAVFMKRVTPVEPDEPEEDDNAGVITTTVWGDLETLEVESAEVGGLWTRIMRLLTTVRGKRVRFIIQVAEEVDTKTGEVVRHA